MVTACGTFLLSQDVCPEHERESPRLTLVGDDGIVVREVRKGDIVMQVSAVLRERLGEAAAWDLETYSEDLIEHWSDEVLETATDRFDNRLSMEMAAMRLEMQKGFGDLRVELLRWSFFFWIGQVVAVASVVAFMLRGVAPR